MPTQDQINDYVKRSGDKGLSNKTVIDDPEKGFMAYEIHGEDFVIQQMYGDGKYWDAVSVELAKKNGCKRLVATTSRNPKALERRLGYKFLAHLIYKEVI